MNTFYGLGLQNIKTGSKDQSVYVLQVLLTALGYPCGTFDGIFGSKTANAVINFKKSRKLPATDLVDMTTWDAVFNGRKAK